MSAILAKATDAQLYVTVTQHPDGRVTGIEISDYSPDPEDLWTIAPRATVWATPQPQEWDECTATTTAKVLDLAVSPSYRYSDGHNWSEGERAQYAFHADTTGERTFLRTVEANLTRAGFPDAHTATVVCQTYGLTLEGSVEHYVFKAHDGWRFLTDDCLSFQPEEVPYPIAPRDASARQLTAAILVHLAGAEDIDPNALPPLYRIRVRYGLWRMTPNWANFKYRTRERIARYRYRITKQRRRITIRTR
ncbi:hypothetical protein [Streptomyces virginiae]|uniref:hypothetical protein n=1 Tax=Streptomyces virginiae TaxID=1961 RepID=UPI0036665316